MNKTASGATRQLALRSHLSCWLACLAVLIGSPALGHASHRALPLVTSQPKTVAGPPASVMKGHLPSPGDSQSAESLSAPNLRFDRLSAADGLSFSISTSVLQDRRGFMWFGTRYGLDKYDGFNFTYYLLESRTDLLFGNYVLGLYQDRAGHLWVGTLSDLVRMDIQTGETVHFKHDPANPQSLGPGQVRAIAEDSTGALWVATNPGLSRYEPSTETFIRYLQDEWVFKIHADRHGGIWLGTGSGLWYYDSGSPEQPDPVRYQNDPADPTSLSSDLVTTVHQDRQGAVWVGTWGSGLDRLDLATGRFTHFQHNPEDPASLSSNLVTSILEDGTGRLWIGTEKGLNLYDRATGRFLQYHYDPDDPQSLSSNVVNDLYEDRSGVLWIATLAGISRVNEIASGFTPYRQGRDLPDQGAAVQRAGRPDPQSPPGLSDNLITAVYQDRRGIVWIGTSSGGLNRLDRSAGQVTVYRHDPGDPTSLTSGEVLDVYEDRAGTLWLATVNGLDRFNPEAETFEAEEALRGQTVSSIVEDRHGNLWASTWEGLWRREPGARIFAKVPSPGDLLAAVRVGKIHPDRTGSLWISTQDAGLFRLDPATGAGSEPTIVHFPEDPGDPKGPGISPVLSFYEDAGETLWMGSVDDGLVRFDRDSQTFTHYSPDTDLARYVSCVQGDEQGFVWMGTRPGLARFDPRSETFAYYDTRDGLIIGEGIVACFQSEQGEMFFGSMQGLNTFFPDQIRDNPNPPPVVITALNLENKALRTDLPPDEQIKLSYRENYLSFDFAALDYAAPAKNQYAYRMEGLEVDWVDAGARRHADYPDLKPGTYTFRVKASNNSGVWNEQGAAVRITITPPFWQTWWFLGLLGVVFMGVIAGGVRLRLRGVEARRRELERQVADRTAELSQANVALEGEIAGRLQVEEALRQSEREKATIDERNRLARELHDSVAQSMYGVTLLAEVASQLLASGRVDQVGGHLGELKETARDSLAEMRLLIYELRPPVLEEEGLASALQARLEAVESRAGLETEFRLEGEPTLNAQVEEALFRIAQEALNNTLKHAHARRAVVTLSQTGPTMTLEIADDGTGFDPAAARRGGGLGLRGMEERAAEIGARLEIESAVESGTRVRVVWERGAG